MPIAIFAFYKSSVLSSDVLCASAVRECITSFIVPYYLLWIVFKVYYFMVAEKKQVFILTMLTTMGGCTFLFQ